MGKSHGLGGCVENTRDWKLEMGIRALGDESWGVGTRKLGIVYRYGARLVDR